MKSFCLGIFLLVFAINVYGAVEIPIHSSRSLRQQVDTYAEMLQKEVVTAKNKKEKYRSLTKALNQIKALRENTPTQSALDESHMDLIVSSLESLPSQSKFKKKDCGKYENDFLNQYEPGADEEPQESAVRPGWQVLQSLCR